MATASFELVPLSDNRALNGLLDRSFWESSESPLVLTWSAHNFGNGNWSASELNRVREAFEGWSNVAEISFVEITSTSNFRMTEADLAVVASGTRLAQFEGAVGLAFLPIPDDSGTDLFGRFYTDAEYPEAEGDIFLDDPESGSFAQGSSDFHTIIHEIGHALGLKHPFDKPRSFQQLELGRMDNVHFTVMSYDHPDGFFAPLDVGWPVTPMPLDILAIQHIYGPNLTYHTDDDVYALEEDGRLWTIWDAGGDDALDASQFAGGGLTIRLQAGAFNFHGDDSMTAIAYGVIIENAIGTSHADNLYGNDAGNLLRGLGGGDLLKGGAGSDVLQGGGGVDQLLGGKGADQLNGDSGADVLHGDRGGDVLVFDAMDAAVIGGKGIDTLLFSGSSESLELTTALTDYRGIEIIDLTGTGDNALVLTADDVPALPDKLDIFLVDGTWQILVRGDAGDEVIFADEGWVQGADVSVEGIPSHTYSRGEATLFVDSDVAVSIEGAAAEAFSASAPNDSGENDTPVVNAALSAEPGGDTLTGGPDNDTFVFSTVPGPGKFATLVDFEGAGSTAGDVIALDDAAFAVLSAGALGADSFVSGTGPVAADANDFILYNVDSGELFYDADGNGAGAAVKFAVLTTHPDALDASDFMVV